MKPRAGRGSACRAPWRRLDRPVSSSTARPAHAATDPGRNRAPRQTGTAQCVGNRRTRQKPAGSRRSHTAVDKRRPAPAEPRHEPTSERLDPPVAEAPPGDRSSSPGNPDATPIEIKIAETMHESSDVRAVASASAHAAGWRVSPSVFRKAPTERDLIICQRPSRERRPRRQEMSSVGSCTTAMPGAAPGKATGPPTAARCEVATLGAVNLSPLGGARTKPRTCGGPSPRPARSTSPPVLHVPVEAEHQLQEAPLALLAQPGRCFEELPGDKPLGGSQPPESPDRSGSSIDPALPSSRVRDARRTIHHVGTSNKVPATAPGCLRTAGAPSLGAYKCSLLEPPSQHL